jgi:hypothetical protein
MLLPEQCSTKVGGEKCQLPPSYVISVKSSKGEYLLAVVCYDHKSSIEKRLVAMQEGGKIPRGNIHFEPIKAVATDCVVGNNEDYIELTDKRYS